MKKLFGMLLALALLLALCVPFVAAADARVIVEAPATYQKAGETFTVTVSIDGNLGIWGIDVRVQYDMRALTLQSVANGEIFDDSEVTPGNLTATPYVLSYEKDDFSNTDANGVLAILTFKVQDGAANGVYPITLLCNDGDAINVDEQIIHVDTVPGSITVVGGTSTVIEPEEETSSETEPIPEPISTPITFTDVKATDWSAEWIAKAVNMGLFKGNADGTFHPNDPITRAQFVTVLWRMAGKPAPKAAAPFADVVGESEEFRNAIAWAYENNVVQGISQTSFSPRGALTREAAMTILFRLAGGQSGMETLMTQIYDNGFTDSGAISAWAKPALYWGYYNEIISGTSAKTLAPQGTATRAQIAKILVGYSEKK